MIEKIIRLIAIILILLALLTGIISGDKQGLRFGIYIDLNKVYNAIIDNSNEIVNRDGVVLGD